MLFERREALPSYEILPVREEAPPLGFYKPLLNFAEIHPDGERRAVLDPPRLGTPTLVPIRVSHLGYPDYFSCELKQPASIPRGQRCHCSFHLCFLSLWPSAARSLRRLACPTLGGIRRVFSGRVRLQSVGGID